MRAGIEGLESPHPIGLTLPGLYHDDDLAQRFTSGLDAVLAPVFTVLDSLQAYVDPRLAPEDFVAWLTGWVGVEPDATWPLERRRALVVEAVELYQWRGTVPGLRRLVEIYSGVEPEIVDSGGTAVSVVPGGALPGSSEPGLTVTVRVDDAATFDVGRLDAIVGAAKPAHVPHQIEVVTR